MKYPFSQTYLDNSGEDALGKCTMAFLLAKFKRTLARRVKVRKHKTVFPKFKIKCDRRASAADGSGPWTSFFDVLPVHADALPSAQKTGKKIQKQPSQSPS
jgi:hypothetical protein